MENLLKKIMKDFEECKNADYADDDAFDTFIDNMFYYYNEYKKLKIND